MAWTIHDLATAVAALPQPVSDFSAARDTLNAQTDPAPTQAMSLGAVQGALLLSGDWLKVLARAAEALTGGAGDAAIMVARTAVALVESKAETVDADHVAAFEAELAVLIQSGDVSSGAQAAIAALAQPTPTVPRWVPPVTVGDIQTVLRS